MFVHYKFQNFRNLRMPCGLLKVITSETEIKKINKFKLNTTEKIVYMKREKDKMEEMKKKGEGCYCF